MTPNEFSLFLFAKIEERERESDERNRLAFTVANLTGKAFAGKLKAFNIEFPDESKELSTEEKRQYKAGMDKMSAQLSGKIAKFPTKTK